MENKKKPVKKTTAKKYTEAPVKSRHLSKDEYSKAFDAKREGRPVAYVMVGVDGVILKAMDVTPIYTENYAGVCAAMKGEGPFVNRAETDGFSSLVCSYARIGLGICGEYCRGLKASKMPQGGIPKPDMLLATGYCCDTRFKWYTACRNYWPNVPVFQQEVPLLRSPTVDPEDLGLKQAYIDYEVLQKHRFVDFLEEQTGTKMNWDRYRECLSNQLEAQKYFYEANRLRAKGKVVMPAQDIFGCVNPYMYNAGDPGTRDFYKDMYEEVKAHQEQGQYVLEDEKYRIVWATGIPPWHQMNLFDYIQSKGGVVIGETTYMPSAPYDMIPVETDDPIREDVTRKWEQTWDQLRRAKESGLTLDTLTVRNLIEEVHPDGLMCHSTKSCRALTVGQLHQSYVLNKNFDLPMLQLEGDMADSREFSEAQTLGMIDAFIETLEARKMG